MSSWRLLVAGFVAAVLLAGVSAFLGYRAGTSSDAAWASWQARTDSLLGAQQARYQHQVAESRKAAALAELRGRAAADSARAMMAGWAAADARADSLRAAGDAIATALEEAATTADSVPLLVALVSHRTRERNDAIASRDSARDAARHWQDAYDEQVRASAALKATIAADTVRILELEGQLADSPKASRWRLRIWRFDVRPSVCATYAVTDLRDGEVAIGPAACVTP